MFFERSQGQVWIGMTEAEFDRMQEMFAHALGAVDALGDQERTEKFLRFVYELNRGNEQFKGPPLPAQFGK